MPDLILAALEVSTSLLRLKEGCAINKSLSALGNVIEKLADRSTGKAPARARSVPPYRASSAVV
eukprot:9503564-Pyramimonas_sp.AAC.1